MITDLKIRNFKRFSALELPLRRLTVLTGLNGTGKSTVLQSLLLARQAAEKEDLHVVQLNGPYGLALGEALDVLHPDADPQEIEISVAAEGDWHKYLFEVPEVRALNLPIISRPETHPGAFSHHGMGFSYLSAERLGPRDQLGVTSDEPDLIGVGVHGEYTAQALALHDRREVRAALRHPETAEHGVTTLRTQVEEWASTIVRPIKINAQWLADITASVIRFQEPELIRQQVLMSEQIRPTNMGFGFSYTLPILVAGLLAPEDGTLVVENPEAHLHPAGQSRLGSFLGQVAGSGTQVILETHSDHVINGIRLAAAEQQTVDSSEVIMHFFGEDFERGVESVEMTRRGSLTSWPRGFFDQLEEDLGRLAHVKRRSG